MGQLLPNLAVKDGTIEGPKPIHVVLGLATDPNLVPHALMYLIVYTLASARDSWPAAPA